MVQFRKEHLDKFTLISVTGMREEGGFVIAKKAHTYPYRSIPPVDCHIAPLYAIWNAGPKLTAKDARGISAIAEEFCQYNGEDFPIQLGRKENIEKRLALVAVIWKEIEAAKDPAASWGRSAMKWKRETSPAKPDDAPSQTSRPSTRAYTLARSCPSGRSAHSSARATRSQNPTLNTPATESSRPAKLRKISSPIPLKGKGKGKERSKESGDLLDAGVRRTSKPQALTSEALHLHDHKLRASRRGGLRFIQRWRAKTKYANFIKPEEIASEVAPPEAQCSPTDILDQRPDLEQTPAAVEHAPMYKVPADVIWTPPGVVDVIPAEAQRTPTLNQRPSKVTAAELVEQKPTAAE